MTERKTIRNYTTSIKVEKTVMEIEHILAKMGATNIFKMYEDGEITGLAFQSIVDEKPIAFKLPVETGKIMQVFNNAVKKGEIPRRYYNDVQQAKRTGWRIIKDWIDSQMSLIAIRTVRFEQVFLPYMYDIKTNQTLFEKLQHNNFQLENKSEKDLNN